MRAAIQRLYGNIQYLASEGWQPYSRLILDSDNAGWVLDWEMREISRIARRLGIQLTNQNWREIWVPVSVFSTHQFFLLTEDWLHKRHRFGFSYFHGLPGTGEKSFNQVFEALGKHHTRITRIQVSHTQMRNVILETGIEPSKVFQIPIAVNLDFFPFREADTRQKARERLGIPQSAFVIGSFQKDGVGWGAGSEPKWIKGPDVFLAVIQQLKKRIPELYVLLSGPARGYVKAGLESMQVPYLHSYLDDYSVIGNMYQALDLYLVTSRQEGGPKAILESLASGVPLVSTRVGQAIDLVEHEQNGWLAEVDDVEALAHWVLKVHGMNAQTLSHVLYRGRSTAEANSYDKQTALWAEFMKGFVACDSC
jgi:glycosyltransferase involved in cell wall biosynthesis